MNGITNCPNCGAPLRRYGKCEYCGTEILQPLQIIEIRPGTRRMVCQAVIPRDIAHENPDMAARYAKSRIQQEMADALTESIKYTTNVEYGAGLDAVVVRGELFVCDPDIRY